VLCHSSFSVAYSQATFCFAQESFEMPKISMRELLDAGVHFGHQTGRWNPQMRPYIYGARNGIHIVDLSKTVRLFDDAYEFLASTVGRGRHVLFVGTKKQAQNLVAEEAKRCGQFYVQHRWLGGMMTNWQTMKSSIKRLKELDRMARDGSFDKFTKKEALMLSRERDKLERNLGGIKEMPGLPGALFVIDPKFEEIAVREANRLEIPVVALTDTNCDPEGIDKVIPGNDDAIRSIRLFLRAAAEACIEGRRRAGNDRPAEDLTTMSFDEETGEVTEGEAAEAEVVKKGKGAADEAKSSKKDEAKSSKEDASEKEDDDKEASDDGEKSDDS
jgi:small subunit ribosomal protein S2